MSSAELVQCTRALPSLKSLEACGHYDTSPGQSTAKMDMDGLIRELTYSPPKAPVAPRLRSVTIGGGFSYEEMHKMMESRGRAGGGDEVEGKSMLEHVGVHYWSGIDRDSATVSRLREMGVVFSSCRWD
jgi:hypothetical protein